MKEGELLLLAMEEIRGEFKDPFLPIWRSPSFKNMRWDIFNAFDLAVGVMLGGPRLVQITTSPNRAARRKKIIAMFKSGRFFEGCFLYSYDLKNERWTKEKFIIDESGEISAVKVKKLR